LLRKSRRKRNNQKNYPQKQIEFKKYFRSKRTTDSTRNIHLGHRNLAGNLPVTPSLKTSKEQQDVREKRVLRFAKNQKCKLLCSQFARQI